jgi:hypothetical protein
MAKPWEKYGAQPGGGIFALPPTEEDVRAAQNEARRMALAEQAAARAAQAQRDAEDARQNSQANDKVRLDASLATQGLMIGPNGAIIARPDGPLGGKQDSVSDMKRANIEALTAQINEVERQLSANFLGENDRGFREYLPSPTNRAFDAAASGLSEQALGAFRTPGVGSQSDAELRAFVEANKPGASEFDEVNLQRLSNIRTRLDAQREAMGLPPSSKKRIEQRDPLSATYLDAGGAPKQSAGFGAETKLVPIPEAMQQEYNAYMSAWTRNPDVGDYVNFRTALDRKYGYSGDAAKQEEHRSRAEEWQKGIMSRKGYTVPLGIGGAQQPMTGAEINANDLLNLGTIPMNAIDAAAMGAPSAVIGRLSERAGQDFAANNEENWKQALGGQVVGAIAGTKGLSFAGGKLAGQLGRAGEILRNGGGTTGQIARNIGTDAVYSGAYSGTQGNNPLTGAALGATGSLLGQGVGSGIGRALTGVKSSPSVSLLREQGVTPTIGQIMRGRATDNGSKSLIAGLEDTISNVSMAGSMVNTARNNALEQANTAVFRNAGEGAPITGTGVEALGQLGQVKSNAYDAALTNVNLPTDDARMLAQLDQADTAGRTVDAARGRGDYGYIADNQLSSLLFNGTGNITGRQMQDALRLLQGQQRSYRQAATGIAPDPMAAGVAEALSGAESALIGGAARNAPQSIPRLKHANRINRGLSVLESATEAAANQKGVFTGAQLGQAIRSNNGKFGQRGLTNMSRSPLFKMQQAMQAVLPNQIPPTGVNAAPVLAIGSTVLGAGNEATGLDSNLVRGLAAAWMLSTPYTKAGAKVIAKALLDRPKRLIEAGTKVRQKKGLFGAAAVPLMLEAGQ